MSSFLATGSTTPAFVFENSDGGLNIIGNEDTPNTFVIGGDANDVVKGGGLNDFMISGAGDDVIEAGAGDDLIFGEDGSDIIRGGEGMDLIRGGKGADYIMGGEGMDIFDLEASDFEEGEIDRYLDFEGSNTDTLRISGVSDPVTYDAATGAVKVGDDTVAYIGKDLDVEVTKLDEDTYDLF